MFGSLGTIWAEVGLDTSKLHTGAAGAAGELRLLDGTMAKTEGSSGMLSQASDMLGSSFAALGRAAVVVEGAIFAAGTVIGGYLVSATLTAARTETLGVAMEAVGKATGTSSALLAEQEAILKKQGVTTQEARGILTLFMQSQLDVAQASKIARVAQDLAVISGENSSEAARTLTNAIASQEPMLLRNYGIVKNLPDIYEEYGKQLGLVTEETDKNGKVSKSWARELTEVEKKQAFVNVILKEGAKVTGVYETAMTKAGKMLTSFPRYFEEVANSIGNAFLPAMAEVLTVVGDFLKQIPDFFAAMEKKTKGKPVELKIAIIFDELEKILGEWWTKNKDAAVEMGGKIGKGLVDGIAKVIVGIGEVITQAISPERETGYESVGKGIGGAIMGGIWKGLKEFAEKHPVEFVISSALLGGQTADGYGAVIGTGIGAGTAIYFDKAFHEGLTAQGGITWGSYWDGLKVELQLRADEWSAILDYFNNNLTTWLNGMATILQVGITGIASDTIARVKTWMSDWNTIMTTGMVGIASDATGGLSSGIINGAGAICNAAMAVIYQALSWAASAARNAWDVGAEFVHNLAAGIWSSVSDIWDAIVFIASLMRNPSPVLGKWAVNAGLESGGKFMSGLNEALRGGIDLGGVQAGLNINQTASLAGIAGSPVKAGSNITVNVYPQSAGEDAKFIGRRLAYEMRTSGL